MYEKHFKRLELKYLPKTPKALKTKKTTIIWRNTRNYLIFCFSVATMHGLIHIVRRQRHILERLLWVILVIGGFSFATSQAYRVWMHYEQSAVVTNIEKDFYNWEIEFPSVTICQRIPSAQAYKMLDKIRTKYNISNDHKELFTQFMEKFFFTNYYTYGTLKSYTDGTLIDYSFVFKEDLIEIISGFFDQIDNRVVKPGKQERTFYPYGKKRHLYTVLTEYGPCIVFNSRLAPYFDLRTFNGSNVDSPRFDRILLRHAETARFKTHEIFFDYYVFSTGTNEIIDITTRVSAGNRSTIASADLRIFDVISSEDIKDVIPKNRNCRFTYEGEDLHYSQLYSYNLCRIDCRIRLCLQFCNCTPYYYKRQGNEEMCDMHGLYCLGKYSEVLISLVHNETRRNLCPCLQNCDTHTVKMELDAKPWFLDTVLETSIGDMPEERYKRILLFTKTDILVQMGGLFGLFLGCSILSLIEIPYFLTLRCFCDFVLKKRIKPNV